jgi:hypothetical protein
MAINTRYKTNFGGALGNTKYSPLEDFTFADADRPICSGMLENRMRLLRSAGLIRRGALTLTVPNWDAIVDSERRTTALPPLLVISSNRAAWIRKGIDIGNLQLEILGLPHYDNAADLRALRDSGNLLDSIPKRYASPPLYAPKRVGANRNVYVVVRRAEYAFYRRKLQDTGITVVGWDFSKPADARHDLSLYGFGASRFAALEFCKYLRRQATPAWDSAWLLDDNVVALGRFPGFAAVETQLGENVACAGFQGTTKIEPPQVAKTWARNELREGRGKQETNPPTESALQLIQQASVWNIDYLDEEANRLNFGPLFITSGEDLSISNYFKKQGITYKSFGSITVYKELPTNDTDTDDTDPENATTDEERAAAASVKKGRDKLVRWITDAENATPAAGATPPPPIMVKLPEDADAAARTLSDFVINKALANAGEDIKAKRTDPAVRAMATSLAMEQLVCGALEEGYVTADAINATFKINGADVQPVTVRNVP